MDPNTKISVLDIRLKTEWEPKCPIPKVMMFCIEPSGICKSHNLEQDDCPLFVKPRLKLPNLFFLENGTFTPLPLQDEDLQIPLGNVWFVVGVFCSKCTHSLMYFQDTK